MNVIIYESSASGGNYRYAMELLRAYHTSSNFRAVACVVPANTRSHEDGLKKILLPDWSFNQRVTRTFWFLLRNAINPAILFFYILFRRRSFILFNDFEQVTAPFWSMLFRAFARRHKYGVFLHDPDRDHYPPSYQYSVYSMRSMMKMMDIALFHDVLPVKPYYQNARSKFVAVPHGTYFLPSPDIDFAGAIEQFKSSRYLFAIIGNIRLEKNYELFFDALQVIPQACVIVAGSPANAGVNIEKLKQHAVARGVDKRVYWQIKYLSESELASVISAVDCVVLNYSRTFTSQSGIISMLAPYKKNVIASRTQSALSRVVEEYQLGVMVEPDSLDSLVSGMKTVMTGRTAPARWDDFMNYASWNHQVEIVAGAL